MTSSRSRTRRLAIVACIVFGLSACGDNSPTASPSTPAATEPAGTDTRVSLVSPRDGETIRSKVVSVTADVQGVTLIDKVGQPPAPGEGHLIFYMGHGYEIPIEPGRPATTGGQGDFKTYVSTAPTYAWPDVPSGSVTFGVQLVNNDDTPLDPPRTAEVTVTVDA